MKHTRSDMRNRGFSIVEVMIALLVISVGLLGIAKMQALAMSSTGGAKMRSIAALEAAGLASILHGDRAYWANITSTVTAPFVVTMDKTGISSPSDTRLTTGSVCTTSPTLDAVVTCTDVDMASYDLNDWLVGNPDTSNPTTGLMNQLPPDSTKATLSCYVPGANLPVGCIITIQWKEALMSASGTGNDRAASTVDTAYHLYVQP